jgi:hypothetical protein
MRVAHRHAATVAFVVACLSSGATRVQAQLPEWLVEADPAVVIGPDAGAHGEFAFILSAARLSDGSVAVVSRGTHDIRVFDARGRHLRTHGRKGAGPGEYDQPSYVGRSGDTLFIFDFSFRRVTALHAIAGVSKTRLLRPDSAGISVYPVVRLADGTLLSISLPVTSMRRPDGLRRGDIALETIGDDGAETRTDLGRFPWLTSLARNPGNSERAMSVGSYEFGPGLHFTRSGDLLIIGDGAEPRLQYIRANGTRVADVALPLERRAFDQKAVAAARDKLLSISAERIHESITHEHEPRYLPETQPYFRELREGPDGEVWVERFRVDRFASAEFLVIGADRKPRARLVLPPGLRPLEVGRDYILGIVTDEDGVENVVMHRYAR